jgi:hypothetical protein
MKDRGYPAEDASRQWPTLQYRALFAACSASPAMQRR